MQRGRMRALGRIALFVAACVTLASSASVASSRYDPRLRFRRISTPRFDIYFHQREEAEAQRLAVIAETVAQSLDATLGRPSGRVHVILVDQSDLSNGWATPVPYNLIEITAAAPDAGGDIGNTDDWLRVVFAHEYTHVVHLGRTRGWIGGLRYVFGRHPFLRPNLFLPQFQIEGIATYEESALTGQGRVPAGDFRLVVDRAASARRFEPLDRASGGLVDWPSGTTPYAYGAYFNRFLAERYGESALRRLADDTAGRLPYFGSRAYRRVFGRPLGELWREYAASRGEPAGERPSGARRLTRHGFRTGAPAHDPGGRLYYLSVTPHDFPALMMLDGSSPSPRRVASRYLGRQTAASAEWVVFDAQEVAANVALQSDLYAVSTRDRRRARLTSGARAADPDVSPDGRTIVCTVQRADRRELAMLPLDAHAQSVPVTLVSEPGTDFGSPRWSPDGLTIVAERRVVGGGQDLVLVDPAARRVARVVPGSDGRSVTPTWTPDGARVVFAADRDGRGFEIFASEVASGLLWRLDGTGLGARSPVFAPDGSSITFVGYSPDGYDLYSLPSGPAAWLPVDPAPPPRARDAAPVAPADFAPGAADDPYVPLRTLAPTFWTPTVESDNGELVAGAATGGADALGRHYWVADVGWSRSRARPDWSMSYAYDRWWPTVYASLSDDTDPFVDGTARTVELDAGVLFPVRRVRWTQSALAAFHASRDSLECVTCDPPVDTHRRRRAVRGGWILDASRAFGYSISREEGWSVGVTTEITRAALGADGNAESATADLRGYAAIGPRHAVVAVRAAAAGSWGDREMRRLFSASGSGPEPRGFDFGSDAIGLLRGFSDSDVVGFRAFAVNLDYRVPFVRVERGAGTLPVFIRTLHGAVFADTGHAWRERFRARDLRVSVGGEISLDTILGHALPLTFTGGAAWRRDGTRGRDVAAFARVGRAF